MAKKRKKNAAATPALNTLDQASVPYRTEIFEGGSSHFGDHAAEQLDISADLILKTLVIDLDPKHPNRKLGVCCIPVSHSLSLKKAAASFGVPKAEMADPKKASQVTGYIPGGISPLGQKTALPTRIDESIREASEVWVSGGKRGLDIGLAPDQLARLCAAEFSDLLH